MLIRSAVSVAALAAGLSVMFAPSAGALTMKECSAKYQAAKAAGTLGNQKWSDFRKSECGTDATAAPDGGHSSDSRRSNGSAESRWGTSVSDCRVSEVLEGIRRQSADAYLSRPIQSQPGDQREWRSEVDRERRRLLQ
jgi:hypothetical protein